MSFFFFFFKQKTAYELRISDWSSDVCSSDLAVEARLGDFLGGDHRDRFCDRKFVAANARSGDDDGLLRVSAAGGLIRLSGFRRCGILGERRLAHGYRYRKGGSTQKQVRLLHQCNSPVGPSEKRSEEHTSELQSLMRISYAVFCLKKKIQ